MKFSTDLKWYLSSTAFFLVPGGIQAVLFPWLIAVYLMESATRVGIAQMAGPLPMLFLILFGGWLGDRVDQRRLSVVLLYCMAIPPILLSILFYMDLVVYEILIGWVLIGGAFGAFAQPARDAMLNRVAGDNIQQIVTLVIGVQFGIQILGFAIGSSADVVGPIIILLAQSAFMVIAALTTAQLPLMPVTEDKVTHASPIADIKAGLKLAWESETIRPAVLYIFGIGLFFAAAYMVILPLMIRDLYGGGARGIAGAYAANMLGTCTMIFFLMRRGGVDRPGRTLILTGVLSSLIVSLLYFEMPQWLFYVVIYFWGMCGGLGMTLSRAIVQEASPSTHLARLMSVFSLGIMAGMPIGSLGIGICIEYIGVRNAVLIPGAGMLAMLLYLYLGTSLYEIRRQLSHIKVN
jgi:MFS family permease